MDSGVLQGVLAQEYLGKAGKCSPIGKRGQATCLFTGILNFPNRVTSKWMGYCNPRVGEGIIFETPQFPRNISPHQI